jgi:uncharacterized membrane protein YccC
MRGSRAGARHRGNRRISPSLYPFNAASTYAPPATLRNTSFIDALVGLSLLLAVALQLERPYWVPVSCMAVIQGTMLRAVWNRNLQRVVGTAIGMLVAWGLLSLPLDPWAVAPILILLSFTVEWLIVRHYGLETVFVTPLTILLAEAARLNPQASHAVLIQSRFLDTAPGCAVGLLGGVVMHQPRLRAAIGQSLRALLPR